MIPYEKLDGDDAYDSIKFGIICIDGVKYKPFVKCPDNDDIPKVFFASEVKDVCVCLTEAKYIDSCGADGTFSDKELIEVISFLNSKDDFYENNSIWKEMYTLWNTENHDITRSEVEMIEMPDYNLLRRK